MQAEIDYWTAKALLDWQVEMGADEALLDEPVNRYELPKEAPKAARQQQPAVAEGKPDAKADQRPVLAQKPKVDAVADATKAAAGAQDLAALKAALTAFEHCPLKAGARNLVFSDGVAGAPIMIIGDAPDRDEDNAGHPFAGQAGHLLDNMLTAIDMGRGRDDGPVYLTNVLPWRPPQNQQPSAGDLSMMLPFLTRHIELAKPKVLVLMGSAPCQALLGRAGITRMRGQWTEALGLPTLPIFHPQYLLRNPAAKRDAWADLLALKAKLKDLT